MDRIGRYKIVRELGRGAMGVVYHAIDPNIGRPVAIKTINLGAVPKAEDQERMRERLFREARSAGILSHPGIVTIYDVEQQDDLAYIAMEYVDGPTLDQLLSGPEALAPERMFSIFGQTAVALDYAHGKGIVHRDIKPANIMIAKDGTAKITDFGIAKVAASEQLTMTGNIVGTPHYMSPVPFSVLAAIGSSLGRWLVPTTPVSRFPSVIEEVVQPFAATKDAVMPTAYVPVSAVTLLPAMLLALWCCGFVAVLLYVWARWRRVAAAVRSSTPLTEGRELNALRRIQWGGPPGLPACRVRHVDSYT